MPMLMISGVLASPILGALSVSFFLVVLLSYSARLSNKPPGVQEAVGNFLFRIGHAFLWERYLNNPIRKTDAIKSEISFGCAAVGKLC